MRDALDIRKSVLYRLAHDQSLGYFKNIRLFGSKQDKYVPFSSTLVEAESVKTTAPSKTNFMNSSIYGTANYIVYNEILHAMSKHMDSSLLEKFEIVFPDSSPSSRDLLGRKGHIAMVEDDIILELFLITNRFHL